MASRMSGRRSLTRHNALAISVFCAVVLVGPSFATNDQPTEPQPPSCGSLDQDNRPNICARLVGGHWAVNPSKCVRLGEGRYRYTHCNGSTQEIQGQGLCCVESRECKGAKYLASCLDR